MAGDPERLARQDAPISVRWSRAAASDMDSSTDDRLAVIW